LVAADCVQIFHRALISRRGVRSYYIVDRLVQLATGHLSSG